MFDFDDRERRLREQRAGEDQLRQEKEARLGEIAGKLRDAIEAHIQKAGGNATAQRFGMTVEVTKADAKFTRKLTVTVSGEREFSTERSGGNVLNVAANLHHSKRGVGADEMMEEVLDFLG